MKKLLQSLLVLLFSGSLYAAVDLNTASVEELQAVKGVGASKAEAIVQHRKQHGPFKRVEELDDVKGFGKKTVERLRSEFTVSKPDKK
ncbi:MAG: helix-hairpin-helix domain-containing protein [Gammaproteobacteria bacterium]|nr:helix-hairpin-helix domain-containing protein [Sideroxydans sp.]MBU3904036.1 helix-hairpin-helix domain-containing protein [Gammaproteobacteria bacterium]MBU4045737.1 helix-hairpin-helix domain-containing protein [Gammaproteobacteria bacterium]